MTELKRCPFCGMRDEACYVNGLNGAKVYQCQWCGAQTICQEDWETRPLEESLRDKNEILQSKLAKERQVSDALYLLLVDDPNTKLKAEQILIDIYGKCEPSPSDVSMTQDVLMDIKTPSSIENTNLDYYKQELSRRDAELLELNDKAGFVFEVPGIPVAKQSTRFTTKGKRPHAYPDKNVEDWQTTVGQYAMVARTDHSWAMTRKPVAVKLVFRLPDRRKRDIDNLEKCVLDGLKGVLFEDDDQVVQVTKRKVINKDHPGVTIIVELDNPVEDCE